MGKLLCNDSAKQCLKALFVKGFGEHGIERCPSVVPIHLTVLLILPAGDGVPSMELALDDSKIDTSDIQYFNHSLLNIISWHSTIAL
jgi:hypothetical protein